MLINICTVTAEKFKKTLFPEDKNSIQWHETKKIHKQATLEQIIFFHFHQVRN